MRYIIIHVLLISLPTLYADIYTNKYFIDINNFENSIVLSFEPDPVCNYEIKFSFWPPIVNVSKEGEGTIIFYEAPTYVDMERMSVQKRGKLVDILLPIRKIKMNKLPEINYKHVKINYEEMDINTELSMLM